jgi:hypothetical protein
MADERAGLFQVIVSEPIALTKLHLAFAAEGSCVLSHGIAGAVRKPQAEVADPYSARLN